MATLLDIATNFASGKEAVRAIFPDSDAKGKRRDEAPEALGALGSSTICLRNPALTTRAR